MRNTSRRELRSRSRDATVEVDSKAGMGPELISGWPGKIIDGRAHPALWHMLDVGAVAACLLARRSLTGDRPADEAAALLVVLHDLGKFSSSLRAMLLGQPHTGLPHWQHSYRLLQDHDDALADVVGATPGVRKTLYAAVAGHHGGPPQHLESRTHTAQSAQIGAEGSRAAREAIDAIIPLFEGASLDGMSEPEARRLSWALCGLTVQADWIGSNPEWFGPKDAGTSVGNYWQQALARAETAISEAGLHHARPLPGGAARVLHGTAAPRPMQAAAADVDLPGGPLLALIEDATGAGKTEAALILAARLMAAGKGDGFFFALPTMATSNAMLARLEAIAPRLFEGRPSLALTHGRASMNALFGEIRGRDASAPGTGATCGRWLADDRRRVLLADIGVGTIDQALMAVLPTRFNTLRLRALSGRILIVDEAHEFGPYMEAQLQRLLQFQAMLGGSAIVMTATLPLGMRDGYAKAFQKGLRVHRPTTSGVQGCAAARGSQAAVSVVRLLRRRSPHPGCDREFLAETSAPSNKRRSERPMDESCSRKLQYSTPEAEYGEAAGHAAAPTRARFSRGREIRPTVGRNGSEQEFAGVGVSQGGDAHGCSKTTMIAVALRCWFCLRASSE